jgi:hypothetical protein
MTKKLLTPKKEDICPNCGTACFATDALCPNCGENLDDLFNQLSDFEKTDGIFRATAKHLSFLPWLTPLLFILSPLIASLVIALPFALRAYTSTDRSPLQLIWYVVPSSTLVPTFFLLISVIPLFLCATPLVRTKLGQRLFVTLTAFFSILSSITLWLGLQTVNMMAVQSAFAFFGGLVFVGWADWVNFVSAVGALLVVLNFMTIIGREKTA